MLLIFQLITVQIFSKHPTLKGQNCRIRSSDRDQIQTCYQFLTLKRSKFINQMSSFSGLDNLMSIRRQIALLIQVKI